MPAKPKQTQGKRRDASSNRHSRTAPTIQIIFTGEAVQKIVAFFTPQAPPPSATERIEEGHHLRPTLRPWIGVIDQILKEDANIPKKYRTTAMQVLQRLRDVHGFSGGYTVVQEYIRQARADAGLSPSRKSTNLRGKASKASSAVQSDPVLSLPETAAPENRGASLPLRLSLHPRRPSSSQEQVFDWMQSIMQGTMTLEFLAGELKGLAPDELKSLFLAATKGERPVRNKALAVLAYARGINSSPICSFLQISSGSLFRYWRVFRKGGTELLFLRKPRSDKKACIPAVQNAVFAVLHCPPSAYGFNRTSWRLEDLRTALGTEYNDSISCDVIREIIVKAGWKWRLARRVLTSNDPEYREKVDRIKKTLAGLGNDEAFFSVDEYGPFAVKKKGGLKRVAPGEQYVVPQWQKSKGYLILTAALELSSNQLTHFYSRKKNTGEMIKLADVLRSKYQGYRTLYLSWDAASWHISKELSEHLEKVNSTAEMDCAPVIKSMPLPAGAQFLNVIESVFSGMARAIIHNSDYPSPVAATEAIDRYIEERNEHFRKHPHRAGKKIWGQERVPSFFAEEHNCKDPMYMFPQ
ncbi:MAG: IS630 family transposase [Acidobacteriota bacterium]